VTALSLPVFGGRFDKHAIGAQGCVPSQRALLEGGASGGRIMSAGFIAYYLAAIHRSWQAAWGWASGQGILLSLLFALAVFVVAILYAVFATRSWSTAMSEIRQAVQRFVVAVVGIPLVVMMVLFIIFFIQDAPTELAALTKERDLANAERDKATNSLNLLKDQNADGFHWVQQQGQTGLATTPYGVTAVVQTLRIRQGFKITVEFDKPPDTFSWRFVSQISSMCQNSMFTSREKGQSLEGNKMVFYEKDPPFTPFLPIVVNAAFKQPISIVSVQIDDN
jgi:hypothetical protein